MPNPSCTVPGCEKPARSSVAEWCPMHYHRWYRHGDVNRVSTAAVITVSHGRKYQSQYLPNHPLASARGKVYVHRAVLWEKIGPGQHPCYWCGDLVEWKVGPPGTRHGDLTVDHLDGHGDNNDPMNLVPSCRDCNSGRASAARAEALEQNGWWGNHDTRSKAS